MKHERESDAPSFLDERLKAPDFRSAFEREALATEFAAQVLLVMEDEGYSKSDLAAMLNCSRAYVTKLLRGDANPTLRTLADVAGALNRRVQLQFVHADSRDLFAGVIPTVSRIRVRTIRTRLVSGQITPWTWPDHFPKEVAA